MVLHIRSFGPVAQLGSIPLDEPLLPDGCRDLVGQLAFYLATRRQALLANSRTVCETDPA